MTGMNLFLIVCFYCVVPIQYFVLCNEAKCKKNLVLGVTLPREALQEPAVQEICDQFRRRETGVLLVLTAGAAAALLLPQMSVCLTYLCFWLIVEIVMPFVPYAKANGKLKRLKAERGWGVQMETVDRTVDMSAAALTERPLAGWMFLLPVVISMLPVVWSLLFERTAPDFWGMMAGCGSITLTIALCWGIYHVAVRKRADVVNDNADLNATLSRIRRHYLGRSFLWISWLTAVFNLFLWKTIYSPATLLVGSLVYCTVLIVIAMYMEFKVRDLQARLTGQCQPGVMVDEDRWWLWGIFYWNPNDKNLMVNNRTGMNTTVNLGRPAGKVLMGACALMLLLMPFLGFWMIAMENTPVTLAVTETELVAAHGKPAYEIPVEDIQSVELLEELPPARRLVGTGMDTLLKGRFALYEDQRALLCLNPKAPPFLLVETKEGETYLFGDENEAQTRSVYERLWQEMAEVAQKKGTEQE